MTENELIWRFTPSRTDPELLESIFVQRQDLLTDIVERVQESATSGNKHHVVLIGPRGIGKTHLISLLHHRVTDDKQLAKRLRIAWMLEDETVTSFVQLLKRIYELLAEKYPEEFPIDWLNDRLDNSPTLIESSLKEELATKFSESTLLLLAENLDALFDGFDKQEQMKWRAYLQENPFTCIIATAQRLFGEIQDREKPFFGFFTPRHLKPLQVEDAIELLSRIARRKEQSELLEFLQTPEGRSRCRALHHLAGGNHRIYIVLSEFISRESLDDLVQPFEKMADELTPYYQERMRWLSAQQRQIVELLCNQDGTCTPKFISRQLLAKENTISGQLKKLSDLGYVTKTPRGRESLYELAEPLMRLASEVKDKRQKPLRMLVDFLRIWYRPEALPGMLESAQSGSLRDHISAAIAACSSSPDPRLEAIHRDIEQAKAAGRMEELVQVLEEQAHTRGTADDWYDLSYAQCQTKDWKSAYQSISKAIEIDPSRDYFFALKAVLAQLLCMYDEAIVLCDKAISIEPEFYLAWDLKGWLLLYEDRFVEAQECFKQSLSLNPDYIGSNIGHSVTLFKTQGWRAGVQAFKELPDLDWQDVGASGLSFLFRFAMQHQSMAEQRECAIDLIELLDTAQHLSFLGDGLVSSLRFIDNERYTAEAINEWRDLWEELGADYEELKLPLRLFRVGIEYLLQKDEAALLDLVESERRIVRQALRLDES